MTPENFENLLIAEIATLEMPVRAYPADPKNYFPEHDPGEVLVRYEGRKPVERDLTGARSLVRYFAEIVVVTRQPRAENSTEGGAYEWLEKIYRKLEGHALEGMAGQLTLDVESFMDEKDGLWQFGQKWSVETYEFQEWNDHYLNENLRPEA